MPTYTPLQSIQLASSSSTVTFSNIPQTYQDLVLVISGGTSAAADWGIRFNSDSTTNYSRTYLTGDGSTASSGRVANYSNGMIPMDFNAYPENNTNFNSIVNLMNYSNANTNKTVLGRGNNAARGTDAVVGLWRSTSAITTIDVRTITGGTTWNVGSTFDLYGISPVAADTAQAFGGTEIYYDSSYVYHVFKGSGTFIPYRNLTVDYLVVAGGGGAVGGGGGAGGLLSGTSRAVTSNTTYTVTVGAGGAGAAYGQSSQTNGGPSSISGSGFTTIDALGGGFSGGTDASPQNGNSGGSGGGAGGAGGTNTGGSGTAGQGNAGGNGMSPNGAPYPGGGGGGAGAAGATATNSAPYAGAGGIGGTSSLINAIGLATSTGELFSGNYYFAGGGAGGNAYDNGSNPPAQGGKGGGASGRVNSNNGFSGTTNTGGGGGGATQVVFPRTGGNGGSGIVVLRYAR